MQAVKVKAEVQLVAVNTLQHELTFCGTAAQVGSTDLVRSHQISMLRQTPHLQLTDCSRHMTPEPANLAGHCEPFCITRSTGKQSDDCPSSACSCLQPSAMLVSTQLFQTSY